MSTHQQEQPPQLNEPIVLRSYQVEALRSIWEAARRARKQNEESDGRAPAIRAVCHQPTGAGKTIEILYLVRELSRRWGWRALVIEPTKELVRQTVRKAGKFTPDRKVGLVRRKKRNFDDCDVVICTAASLHTKALAEIDPSQFQIVIVDEAHHGAAATYEEILEHFNYVNLILGFTATPIRGDGTSVAGPKHFHSVIVYHTIGQLTHAGALCKARGVYVHTGLVLENVPIRRGNYDERKLAHAVNTPERNRMAVEAYLNHAPGELGLVFAANIQHAQDLAATFNEQGVPAAAVWGEMAQTDPEQYEEILRDYRARGILVLCNAKLLTEGFDEPQISIVIITRPSTEASGRVLGPQMIGRGLRTAEGKEEAIIIELIDNAILAGGRNPNKEKAFTLNSLIANAYGVSTAEIEAPGGYLHEKAHKARVEDAWRERLKLYQSLRTIDAVQETFDVIERVSKVSEFVWIPLGAKTYYMSIGEGSFCEVVEERENYFEVRAVQESELTFIGSGPDLKSAIAIADSWVATHGINYMLQQRNQPWRQKDPTDNQVATASRLTGLPESFLRSLKRGQLSDLITSACALLMPVGELKAGDGNRDEPTLGEGGNLHMWQFGAEKAA